MFFYRIPSPNEALVITGAKSKADNFRILTGKGAFVSPFRSRTLRLSLDSRQSVLNEPCVTQQGIALNVEAIAVFKVGNDEASISSAARRFVDQQRGMDALVGQMLAGHLRSIVGGLTVESIIRDRNALAQQVRDSATDEMSKLGLVIDSFQIREIGDPSNYIQQLAAPHIAEAEKNARMAKADADQAATEKEQEVIAAKAGFTRDAEIAQAEADGQAQAARKKADQEGPLAEAQAQQAVAEQNAELAKKNAEVTEARLESEVRKPADAQAYAAQKQAEGEALATRQRAEADKYTKVTAAEAERDATKARAEAAESQAEATNTIAQADANAIQLKNDALKDGNVERQVATMMVDKMPEIVEGLATSLRGANVTIFNGADGFGEMVMGLVGTGKNVYDLLIGDMTARLKVPTNEEPANGATDKALARGRQDG